jgi:methylenetetrahydrofolate reductase (NADPH)
VPHTGTGKSQQPTFSFEFFPPRTALMQRKFWRTVGRMEALSPAFFSVTYGALGSGQTQSVDTVKALCAESDVPVAAHLTCVGANRETLNAVIHDLRDCGIRGVVALRGDGEEPGAPFCAHPDGYQSVPELVTYLRGSGEQAISVAAYPEVHPQASSPEEDLLHLKRKLDAGADQAITQYFFEAEDFLRFRDRAIAAGIAKPIIPGILPIHNYQRVVQFSQRCGASVPTRFADDYARLDNDPQGRYEFSVALAVRLGETLMAEGVSQFHFYTLNQTDLSHAVCCELLREPQ